MAKTPHKLKPRVKTRLLSLIRKGVPPTHACKQVGVTYTAMHYLEHSDAEFKARLDQCRAIADARNNERVEQALLAKALGGNVTAQIYWLQNRNPSRWVDTRKPESVVNVTTLPPEAMKKELEDLLKNLEQEKPNE